MTLVVIGPVTNDLIIKDNKKSSNTGGATYYQSFVFEKYCEDYLAIVNCSEKSVAEEFPNPNKVKVILKNSTHFFINNYPKKDNPDIRQQLSNFAQIPILKEDLKHILKDIEIDAIIINPLNRFDFPLSTIEYLKTFNVPIYISVQGFLRTSDRQVNGNYTIKLSQFNQLPSILSGVNAIFLDELEENIIGSNYDVDEIVITDGSKGSRIIHGSEIKIEAVKCRDIVDTTGCGDTYMAAYISMRLKSKSIKYSAEFASKIASKKIESSGPFTG